MITTCPKCHQEYDDVYHSTQCPHEYFQMHCGVFVKGKQGCAHTVEEQRQTDVVPNPDCPHLQMLQNLSEAIDESIRLKTLSNEDLVRECIKIEETNYPVVDEMCNRLFPNWAEEGR